MRWSSCYLPYTISKSEIQAGAAGCNDKLDNDCNGQLDQKDAVCKDACIPGVTRRCYRGKSVAEAQANDQTLYIGACRPGLQTCGADQKWSTTTCVGEVAPKKETCDKVDNDCDGEVDEDLTDCNKASICKSGETQRCYSHLAGCTQNLNFSFFTGKLNISFSCKGSCTSGYRECVNGGWGPCKHQITPKNEGCSGDAKGRDDNCDGQIDEDCECKEGTTQKCYSGNNQQLGKSSCKEGVQECKKGIWGSCQGEVAPKQELCNGKDDDCDGQVDEKENLIYPPCLNQTGVCRGSFRTCQGLNGWSPCDSQTYSGWSTHYRLNEDHTHCDGLDNDCDGLVDEGCDKGSCCQLSPNDLRYVTPENCNINRGGFVGLGECTLHCCQRPNQSIFPLITDLPEHKNCTTAKAKDATSFACKTDTPVCCIHHGPYFSTFGRCLEAGGQSYPTSSPKCAHAENPPNEPNPKENNGRENFNDRESNLNVDAGENNPPENNPPENNPPENNPTDSPQALPCNGSTTIRNCSSRCGTGVEFCVQGFWQGCTAKKPDPFELCDGIDNDCDGKIDNVTRVCQALCGPGIETCIKGIWSSCSAPTPKPEICDGKDNDCDGLTDEDFPQRGRPCIDSTKQGDCANGTYTACQNSKLICTPQTPQPEICDGKDNDCDGQIDENAVNCVVDVAGICQTSGFKDGPAKLAQFFLPAGISVNQQTGLIYIADFGNQRIRKIDANGTVSTVAGAGTSGTLNGPALLAQFNFPFDLTNTDEAGKKIYITDSNNFSIRLLQLSSSGDTVQTTAGSLSGLLDGNFSTARFSKPFGIVRVSTSTLYVSDFNNDNIRKLDLVASSVTTLTGNGKGLLNGSLSQAKFSFPNGLAYNPSGAIYVSDTGNHIIRQINLSTSTVSTLAGTGTDGHADGTPTTAKFSFPRGLAFDGKNTLYISQNTYIRKIDLTTNAVSTIAGTGQPGYLNGPASKAKFNTIQRLKLDRDGNLIIADSGNHCIRKLILK